MSILHILVNYNNAEETLEFCREIRRKEGRKFENQLVKIVVVDNPAPVIDKKLDLRVLKNLQVEVMFAPTNLGYFGAADFALRNLRLSDHSIIILSNCDLKLEGESFYQTLEAEFSKATTEFSRRLNRQVAVLGPRLYSTKSHSNTNPFLTSLPSKLKFRIWSFFLQNYWLWCIYMTLGQVKSWIKKFSSTPEKQHQELQNIYANHGAFLVISAQFILEIGGQLNHSGFLYLEEISLAERVRKANWIQVYTPAVSVVHTEHGTLGLWNYLFSKKSYQFRAESFRAIRQEFFRNT